MKNAVLDAAYQWFEIGQALDIPPGTLKTFHGEDPYCLNEMLTVWMHSGKATIDQLLQALEDPGVGRHDIVNDIRALKGDRRCRVGLA